MTREQRMHTGDATRMKRLRRTMLGMSGLALQLFLPLRAAAGPRRP